MTKGTLFWVLMIAWALFGLWAFWPAGGNYRPIGFNALLFVLLGLLGWQTFGAAVK